MPLSHTVRPALSSCVMALLSFLVFVSCQSSEQQRPNILFIMSDDHTSQAWGVYGGILDDHIRTPNIARLRDEGALLTNVFCTNSICTPSRASILTGKYSHENGIYTLSEALHPDSMHVAKALQERGYTTAVIGKWHLKSQPSGFDYFNVLPGQGRYRDPILRDTSNWPEGQQYEGFSTDVIADQSIDWLEHHDRERPFMLMTHFKATHEPFDYPARMDTMYEDVILPEPSNLMDFDMDNGRSFSGQNLERLGQRWVDHSDRGSDLYPGLPISLEGMDSVEVRKAIYQKFAKDFLRSGSAIDENIGKLLDYLDRTGLADNTVVIYTSDQGYFMGEHGFFDKRMFYEEALRMPFVIRYPKEITAGSKVDDMILNIDFASLFMDYAGHTNPDFGSGRSFRSTLSGNTPGDWRTSMYYRYWLHQTNRPAHYGVRNERYKLIYFYGDDLDMPGAHREHTVPSWEFYDLHEDPYENYNVYHDTRYQKIIARMKNELIALQRQVNDQ